MSNSKPSHLNIQLSTNVLFRLTQMKLQHFTLCHTAIKHNQASEA